MYPFTFGSKRIVVTGASSGLGRELALQLSRQGAHPIVVARRADRLTELSAEIIRAGGTCSMIVADLTVPADLDRVFAESIAAGPVHGVILNAGSTWFGEFQRQDSDSIDQMIALNVHSTVVLCRRFVPYLRETHDGGALMLVASMAAFNAVPYQALYGATKSFVHSFATALREELAGGMPSVTVIYPGGMSTEMMKTSGLASRYHQNHPLMMSPDVCARIALEAMKNRRRSAIPGWLNRLGAFGIRLMPGSWVSRLIGSDYRKALPKDDLPSHDPQNPNPDR